MWRVVQVKSSIDWGETGLLDGQLHEMSVDLAKKVFQASGHPKPDQDSSAAETHMFLRRTTSLLLRPGAAPRFAAAPPFSRFASTTVTVSLVRLNGDVVKAQAAVGETLLDVARANAMDEDIEGICGGLCACATCHVYVDEPYLGLLDEQDEDEEDTLDASAGTILLKPNSRLGCQIQLTAQLDGLVATVAPTQAAAAAAAATSAASEAAALGKAPEAYVRRSLRAVLNR